MEKSTCGEKGANDQQESEWFENFYTSLQARMFKAPTSSLYYFLYFHPHRE